MKLVLWFAVLLMLFGAAMLVADVAGVAGLWIAVIAVGIALVALALLVQRPHAAR